MTFPKTFKGVLLSWLYRVSASHNIKALVSFQFSDSTSGVPVYRFLHPIFEKAADHDAQAPQYIAMKSSLNELSLD